MGEMNASQADTLIRATLKGFRGTDEEQKPSKPGHEPTKNDKRLAMLKKAGITAKTPFLESIKALAPVVQEEAAKRGVSVDDVLAETFQDERTRRGMGVAINRGVVGANGKPGVIADRQEYAKQFQGIRPAQELISKY